MYASAHSPNNFCPAVYLLDSVGCFSARGSRINVLKEKVASKLSSLQIYSDLFCIFVDDLRYSKLEKGEL